MDDDDDANRTVPGVEYRRTDVVGDEDDGGVVGDNHTDNEVADAMMLDGVAVVRDDIVGRGHVPVVKERE